MENIVQFIMLVAMLVSAIGTSIMAQVENVRKGEIMKFVKFMIYLIIGMIIAALLKFTPEATQFLPIEFQNYSITFVIVMGLLFGLAATGTFDTIKKLGGNKNGK